MAGHDRSEGPGLLDEQPQGSKAKAGRLLGSGGSGSRYRRAGGTAEALARSLRIAQRRPQAILKITRFGHGGSKILGHIEYIRRHGKLSPEDENGTQVDDIHALRKRVRWWAEQAGAGMKEPGAAALRKRRVTAHFILDAGANAKPEALTQATRQFLSERFGNDGHEYVFVRHDDTKQPHVHVVLSLMNAEGKRLHTSVAELQAWREHFAKVARDNGIDVDATRAWERGKSPTRSRGVIRTGASKPARWTREQVKRGLEARRQRLLSQSIVAASAGDPKKAAALKAKAATLRMRTVDQMVQRVAAEGRAAAPTKAWEVARVRNAREVAQGFRDQSDALLIEAKAAENEPRRQTLRRASISLRILANETRPTPTRGQQIATALNVNRGREAGSEPEIDR